MALLKEHGGETYDFHLRETQTYEIIEDVALLKSEVGVLYLSPFNETVLKRRLRRTGWDFICCSKRSRTCFWVQKIPLQSEKASHWRT